MTSTIRAVEEEVSNQPGVLADLLKRPDSMRLAPGTILVGAGDSYAAAECVSQLLSFRYLAADPLSVLAMSDLGDRDICIISVSGRTKTNVEVATMAKMTGRSVTAVTSFASSPLASSADNVVLLPFRPSPKSPGMLSFSMTLLALLKMTVPGLMCDFRHAFEAATPLARSLRFSRTGTTFLLGDWALYGACIYGAAKVYELLGLKAHAEQLEQFGHMELFSLSRRDSVNIITGMGSSKPAGILHTQLLRHRYGSSEIQLREGNGIERLFASVFALQLGVIRKAKSMRIKRPRFLDSRSALAVSDSVIY